MFQIIVSFSGNENRLLQNWSVFPALFDLQESAYRKSDYKLSTAILTKDDWY